jgi:hypothetical protein
MTTSSGWPVGFLEILNSPNCGPTCWLAHCCCQPCVWASALNHIEVSDAYVLGCGLCCGGRGCLDELAAYVGRRAVARHYNVQEHPLVTCCITCLFGPCGRVQEVESIVQREGLTYELLRVKPRAPVQASADAPVQASMVRSSRAKATMARSSQA